MRSVRPPVCGMILAMLIAACMAGCGKSAEDAGAAAAAATAARREAEPTASAGEETNPPTASPAAESMFTAYYFHWTVRCQTCLEIEEMSRAAIFTSFADQLERGTLRWQARNMELPEYAHFLDDFDLSMPSLVLVRRENEVIKEWKVLQRVWDLVEEPWNLEAYVVEETQQFLSPPESAATGESAPG